MSHEAIAEWKPWTPDEVFARLKNLTIPWHVAGGWALDLWRGTQTRPHEDIEIEIPRADFLEIRKHLSGFKFYTAGSGTVHPLPENTSPPATIHQTWVLDEAAAVWRMDIFLAPGDAHTWIYRRDETIQGPLQDFTALSIQGIPYLKPEVVLFYKAKATREKDQADFNASLPHLDKPARDWLRDRLKHSHPHHIWLSALA